MLDVQSADFQTTTCLYVVEIPVFNLTKMRRSKNNIAAGLKLLVAPPPTCLQKASQSEESGIVEREALKRQRSRRIMVFFFLCHMCLLCDFSRYRIRPKPADRLSSKAKSVYFKNSSSLAIHISLKSGGYTEYFTLYAAIPVNHRLY